MTGIIQAGQPGKARIGSELAGPVRTGFDQASASQVFASAADESAVVANEDYLSNVDLILIFQGLLGARDES